MKLPTKQLVNLLSKKLLIPKTHFFFFLSLLFAHNTIAAESTPESIVTYLKSILPLRSYETFSFTDEEYLRVAKGESVFKTRDIAGTPIKEGGVSKLVNIPAWKIWRVVTDEYHHNQYMPQIKFATVLKGQGSGREIFDYLEIPIVSDRQWIVTALNWGDLWKKSAGKIWLVTFNTPKDQLDIITKNLESGKIPADIKKIQSDAIIIKESRASYTMIELPDGRTIVEYRAFSDPAGKIPASILNLGLPSTAKKLVNAIEERAKTADSHFSDPKHPIITDPIERPIGTTKPTL